MDSINGVKAQLNLALNDDRDRMVAAALSLTRERIARLQATLEGSNNSESQSIISAEMSIAQLLEQAAGNGGASRDSIERAAANL